MPFGLKLAIGCIVIFFAFAALITVVFGVGGFWLKGQADGFVEGVEARAEAQQEASAILDRLRESHSFTAPQDGRIDPASAERFLEATRIAWRDIEPVAMRLHEVAERNREGEARIGDVLEGARMSGLLIDSRLHIARALEEVGMSLAEYVWTGGALGNARRDANAPAAYRGSREAGDPVTLANIGLAEHHESDLDALEGADGEPGPAMVLGLAQGWSVGLPSVSDFSP